ncbi:cell wall hydrolase/autolysin [Caldicellulosiruptor hydrothermalis 108]|uniref:Cell wall hydrolase/autolysin n=1 Tax=Caldicellulosiruptor hydrothermalis (strain DSM 18901 / VKM B-2411 / 108) TaxID=632292 RepID=E4QE32_CALH1|nr:N-acetylmuramoyl-L-alanine amidase [Caldicellulosiruptor hydrothermalis]ADQ06526.1 cell wall hydrolase/autolysin [Caldicellulosiruptor hydrothermalis 108]
MKICIDPGHGGSDPGAVANGLKEKDLTLQISLEVAKLLKAAGHQVILTRDKDIYVPLNIKRTPACDISVSIHINAGSGQGVEVWHALYNKPQQSKMLASYVLQFILKSVPALKNRGLKNKKSIHGNWDYYFMLRCAKGIPILVECGFIDSSDAKILKTRWKDIAKGIANGILEFIKAGGVKQ